MKGRYRSYFFAKDYPKCVVAKGKCQLDGPPQDYEPLFTCVNFSSQGFRTMFASWIVQRTMHPVSTPEYEAMLMFHAPEWGVINLAEQYALDPALTREIAFMMQIDHPAVHGVPIIMSTDLVVAFARPGGVPARHAYAVKKAKDLSPRVVKKLAIEQAYWTMRNTPWSLLLDIHLPRQLVQNMELLMEFVERDRVPCDDITMEKISAWLLPHLGSSAVPLRTVCKRCDAVLQLSPGTALSVAYHLTLQGRLSFDLRGAHLPTATLPKPALAA